LKRRARVTFQGMATLLADRNFLKAQRGAKSWTQKKLESKRSDAAGGEGEKEKRHDYKMNVVRENLAVNKRGPTRRKRRSWRRRKEMFLNKTSSCTFRVSSLREGLGGRGGKIRKGTGKKANGLDMR